MKFSITVQLGNVNVAVDAEGENPSELVPKFEACKEQIKSLLSLANSLQESLVGSTSASLISTGTTSSASNPTSAESFLANHIEKLQSLSQHDQMLAILYANFKNDPNSSISPTELAASFGELGFVRPVNPSDVLTKAARKGVVTLAGGNERGRYRLTVPGRKRAAELLGFQA